MITDQLQNIKDNVNDRCIQKSLKEYINYTENINCFGIKSIKYDAIKIDEYHQEIIQILSKKYDINIDLVKLIDSNIILSNNKKNNQIRLEEAQMKNNNLIMICQFDSLKNLNEKIYQIITFCNSCTYTKDDLRKKVDEIVYKYYDKIINMKISENSINIKLMGLNLDDINNFIISKINKEVLYCFDFVRFVFSLKDEEYNRIKQNIEEEKKLEEEEFNKKMELILQAKNNEITSKYDKLIKNVIENNEKKCNELNKIIRELKDNGETASLELLNILEEKEKIKQNNIELEQNIMDLIKKNKVLEEKIEELEKRKLEEVKFIEDIIRRSSISDCEIDVDDI